MKNQYFGDKRDYFKYDLLLSLLEAGSFPAGLTLIPMLTSNSRTPRDGLFTDYERGEGRADLHRFLRECLVAGRRDVRELRTLFSGLPYAYTPYRDDSFFTHMNRPYYFSGIADSALAAALVFLDPDNGIEVKSMTASNGEKYVRYAELGGLLDRMDARSVLVVYQHLPHEKRPPFFRKMKRRLVAQIGVVDPACVSDNEIAFFLMARNDAVMTGTRAAARAHATKHALLYA